MNGIGVPFVLKSRVIVHNTIGTPNTNKTMPSGNLTGSGIDNPNTHILSNHGARMIMIATAPYQNNAPAIDQNSLRRSFFAATR